MSLTNAMGAKFFLVSPTLRHRTPRALCHSVEKNIDSLVEGLIFLDQGGGGEGGGKRSWTKSLPPVSPLSVAFFAVVCARIFFVVSHSRQSKNYFAGEDPPDPLQIPANSNDTTTGHNYRECQKMLSLFHHGQLEAWQQ